MPERELRITDPDGSLIQTIPITSSAPAVSFHWLSPQVIALLAGEEGWRFYALPEAELLFTWQQVPGIILNQYSDFPALSPDGRWLVLERHLTGAPEEKQYSLYDIQSRQEIPLYQGKGHQLEVSAWSPDSQTLYLLHYPTNPEVERDPNLPFGLLAYTPQTNLFELLVLDAVYAQWNRTSQRAIVYYQPLGGKVSFAAGIWDTSRGNVFGGYPLRTDFPTYSFTRREFMPAAWSPDGELAAFFTWSGELVLMNLDGQTQLLADQIGQWRSDFIRLLAWSPDNSRLFASDRSTAWIITVPKSGQWRGMIYDRSLWATDFWTSLYPLYETALLHRSIPGCVLIPGCGRGLDGTGLSPINETIIEGSSFKYITIINEQGQPVYSNGGPPDAFTTILYTLEHRMECVQAAEKVFESYTP